METRRQENVSGDRQTMIRRNTRSKTSENGRENSSLPIPVDVIIDIFSRLPLKSIAICRCVSKLWASILLRSDFTDLFLTKSSARPQLLFITQKGSELFFFSSPQPQSSLVRSSSVGANLFSHFTLDSSCEFREGLRIVNGLVCLEYLRKERVPVIFNPSTGQSLTLPKSKRNLLGYDPVDKQFKVLSMTYPSHGSDNVVSEEYQVLTLGTGNMSWRVIQCCIPYFYPFEEICINGVLYYTSINQSERMCKIVCFDVRSEKFSLVKVKETRLIFGTLINYQGKLGLILSEDNEGYFNFVVGTSTSIKLWVLEDVEKQEWSEHVYVLPPSWKNIVGEAYLRFAGVTRTKEIVLSPHKPSYPFYLFYFSIERNIVVRVEIQGMDASNYDKMHPIFLDHVEDVKLYASL